MNKHILSTILLLILDFLWIYLYMTNKYKIQIKNIQKHEMNVKYIYVLFAYILMIIGLNIFVIPKINKQTILYDSLIYGFTFGFILYGVYDFTIASVISDWDINLAIIDILWGGFVFFISSYIGVLLSNNYES